jgi:ParB/RepB/Spo0J family partition protein
MKKSMMQEAGKRNLMPRAFMRPWAKQPRKHFDPEKMRQLSDSLKAVGQLQALLVRPLAEAAGEVTHEVIVGERRWRAAEAAGLDYLEVRVVEMDDKEALELSVMENVHRDDLSVMEEAEGYAAMVKEGWSVVEISQRSGRSDNMIWELLNLTKLDEETREELNSGTISRKVAEALGKIEDLEKRATALKEITIPTYQRVPLARDEALRLINNGYLNPQKLEKEWAGKQKSLKKKFPGMMLLRLEQYADNQSDYEQAYQEIETYRLAVHARDKEKPETWEDLAKRHGGEFFVAPDEDVEPVVLVLREPLRTAELAAGEVDPLNCIFPLTGKGRHEQGMEKQRQGGGEDDGPTQQAVRAELEALLERNEERKRIAAQLLHRKLCHAKEGWKGGKNPSLYEKCRALMEWLMKNKYMCGHESAAALQNVDVSTLGDGDEEKGAQIWAANLAEDRGPAGCLAVMVCETITEMLSLHCDFEEEMKELEAILGVGEGT